MGEREDAEKAPQPLQDVSVISLSVFGGVTPFQGRIIEFLGA